MTRLTRHATVLRSEGLVLIEVMMAVVLLALLIVPLVSGFRSIAATADGIRNGLGGLLGPARDSEGGAAWKWGEAVSAAWWLPGPTLHLRAASGGYEDCVVGLWVDGWFLGEREPDEDGHVELGARAWADLVGDELVVRVRGSGSPWGPPWRLVVPGADGKTPALDLAAGGGAGETAVHVPALGTPALEPSWVGATPDVTPRGLPLIFPSPGPGLREIDLDGRRQLWKSEASRDLDIYF